MPTIVSWSFEPYNPDDRGTPLLDWYKFTRPPHNPVSSVVLVPGNLKVEYAYGYRHYISDTDQDGPEDYYGKIDVLLTTKDTQVVFMPTTAYPRTLTIEDMEFILSRMKSLKKKYEEDQNNK